MLQRCWVHETRVAVQENLVYEGDVIWDGVMVQAGCYIQDAGGKHIDQIGACLHVQRHHAPTETSRDMAKDTLALYAYTGSTR
jgi:hypothetical protein